MMVIPRPGADTGPPAIARTILAPTETSFTQKFGALLPPARFLTTGHGKAAYYSIPAKSAPQATPLRVLFVHGVQTPALGMLPLATALQLAFPHAHCVLFDHWGHGLSDTPLVPHVPALFLSLIDDILDELEWQTIHLVGFSFGGSTVASYVARSPERAQSMSLIAPAGLLRPDAFSAEQRSALCGSDEAAAKDAVFGFLEGGPLIIPADWEQRVAKGEIVAEAVRQWELDAHKGYAASVVGIVRDGGVLERHAVFMEAAKSGVPNIAVLGGMDGICTSSDLQGVGISNIVVVPRVGHALVRERATEVAGSIAHFWSTLSN